MHSEMHCITAILTDNVRIGVHRTRDTSHSPTNEQRWCTTPLTHTHVTHCNATRFASRPIAKSIAAQRNPPSKRSNPGGVTTNDERHDFFTHGVESSLDTTGLVCMVRANRVAAQRISRTRASCVVYQRISHCSTTTFAKVLARTCLHLVGTQRISA